MPARYDLSMELACRDLTAGELAEVLAQGDEEEQARILLEINEHLNDGASLDPDLQRRIQDYLRTLPDPNKDGPTDRPPEQPPAPPAQQQKRRGRLPGSGRKSDASGQRAATTPPEPSPEPPPESPPETRRATEPAQVPTPVPAGPQTAFVFSATQVRLPIPADATGVVDQLPLTIQEIAYLLAGANRQPQLVRNPDGQFNIQLSMPIEPAVVAFLRGTR